LHRIGYKGGVEAGIKKLLLESARSRK